MPIPGLNPERCRLRNRLAARLDGLNATPIAFLASGAPGADERAPALEGTLLARMGSLPASPQEELAQINEHVTGDEPLSPEKLYVHYCEAGSDRFIPDRYMFLGESTLRNVAQDAARGFALMNSHRTGGLSSPSELPYGRTFAGRYEHTSEGGSLEDGGGSRKRCVLGVYMLRTNAAGEPYRPNGSGGPSTADLHAGIEGGTIFDVSLGLYGGEPICDLCGENLNETKPGTSDAWGDPEYLCPHAPGTYLHMTPLDRERQQARGVPDGKCSYTLENARPGEVSPVFDGAVPGAGFRKALSLAQRGKLDGEAVAHCRSAYQSLCHERDFEPRAEGGERRADAARAANTAALAANSGSVELTWTGAAPCVDPGTRILRPWNGEPLLEAVSVGVTGITAAVLRSAGIAPAVNVAERSGTTTVGALPPGTILTAGTTCEPIEIRPATTVASGNVLLTPGSADLADVLPVIESLLSDPEGLLDGLTLDDHARVVLAAAGVLATRLETLKSMRAAQDRTLSEARFADRDRLVERLQALGVPRQGIAARLRALRARLLQYEIDRREPVGS